MKRYLITFLAVMLLLGSVILMACSQNTSSTKTFQNDQYGYSINIPNTWTTKEERSGQTITFNPSHDQMEIIVNVDSEESLSNFFSEAKSRGVNVEGMTPLELVIRASATESENLGAQGKRIDWNEHAVTTFTLVETMEWKSWVKTCYIVDKGNFYMITFKVLGYSESEFEEYRDQINNICKSFRIDGSTVISLPEGQTIFDF